MLSMFVVFYVTDKQQELDLPTLKVEDTDAPNSTGAAPNKKKDKKTTPMSQISGVRKLKHTNSFTGMLPRYGVECANEEDLNKVSDRLNHIKICFVCLGVCFK